MRHGSYPEGDRGDRGGCGCGCSTVVIIALLLYIVHLLGGC